MQIDGEQGLAVGRDLLPPHVGGVGEAHEEGQGPEAGERAAGEAGGEGPAQATAVEAHQGEDDRAGHREQRGDDVTEGGGPQQSAGQGPMAARLQAPGDDAQEQQGQGEADGEGELSRQR